MRCSSVCLRRAVSSEVRFHRPACREIVPVQVRTKKFGSPSPSSDTIQHAVPQQLCVPPAQPRCCSTGYIPLSTAHPVFGQQQKSVPTRPPRKTLLSTEHPAFGTKPKLPSHSPFSGSVSISGFFLAVDPAVSAGRNAVLNPNAQLTIKSKNGQHSRVRYTCQLNSSRGIRLEAIIRFQVGWISPRVVFSELPHVIHLGRGFDVSLPFLFHFTMVSILDEHGCATGSSLYFSGTPMLGLSMGISRISGGKLILNPTKDVDPAMDSHDFYGSIHYRQVGFVIFKVLAWVCCTLMCIPAVAKTVVSAVPDPWTMYSERHPSSSSSSQQA